MKNLKLNNTLWIALLALVALIATTPLLAGTYRCFGETTTIPDNAVSGNGDTIYGSHTVEDVISTRGGNDEVYGLGLDDCLCGDTGADELDGGAQDDMLDGGNGSEVSVDGGNGYDVCVDSDTSTANFDNCAEELSSWP